MPYPLRCGVPRRYPGSAAGFASYREVKWSEQPVTEAVIEEASRALLAKGAPHERWAHGRRLVHALFVPRLARTRRRPSVGRLSVIITAEDIIVALR